MVRSTSNCLKMEPASSKFGSIWTKNEHLRFIEALEKYGDGNSGAEWGLIVNAVQSRSFDEVKLHAQQYFIQLQNYSQHKCNQVENNNQTQHVAEEQQQQQPSFNVMPAVSHLLPANCQKKRASSTIDGGANEPNKKIMITQTTASTSPHTVSSSTTSISKRNTRGGVLRSQNRRNSTSIYSAVSSCNSTDRSCTWTEAENTIFEDGLANNKGHDRWFKISSLLRRKTAEEVKSRFEKLCMDVQKIENGQDIVLRYKSPVKLEKPKLLRRKSESFILSHVEEKYLFNALQDSKQMDSSSPEANISLTTAVVAIANTSKINEAKLSNQQIHLRNRSPSFSKECAKTAIQAALVCAKKSNNQYKILETLIQTLNIHPLIDADAELDVHEVVNDSTNKSIDLSDQAIIPSTLCSSSGTVFKMFKNNAQPMDITFDSSGTNNQVDHDSLQMKSEPKAEMEDCG